MLPDFVVKKLFYRQERQEGQERQKIDEGDLVIDPYRTFLRELAHSGYFHFGVLGPLGDRLKTLQLGKLQRGP